MTMTLTKNNIKKVVLLTLFSILLPLSFSTTPEASEKDQVMILVDGVPLDAKGIVVGQDIFIPAWILENYGTTRIIWKPGDSILELNTAPPDRKIEDMEGDVTIKIGFYTTKEGFIIGKNTRVFLFNVNPETLTFEDGKTIRNRAHDSTIAQLQPLDDVVASYLDLSPPDRFYKKGWEVISTMNRKAILDLNRIVEEYESLYRDFYFDLLSTLVLEKDSMLNESASIIPEMKDIKSIRLITDDEGEGKVSLANGTYFIFCRMYQRGSLILWNLPVTVTGSDISVELTNRNATFMK